MAPLNPTANKCYSLSYPIDNLDDRLNLKVRTGAATCIIYSRIFAHGGLTLGLNLPEVSLLYLHKELPVDTKFDSLISNELFELVITERRWTRRQKNENDQALIRPKPRIFHTIVGNEDKLYLSGGLVLNLVNEFEPVSDLWMFNLCDETWTCLCEGNSSNKGRFGHSMVFFDYPSSFNKSNHQGLLIVGGKTKNDAKVPEFDFFDLTDKIWIGDVKKILPIEDIRIKLPNKTEKTQKKVVFTSSSDSAFTVFSDHTTEPATRSLIGYTKLGSNPTRNHQNPLIEFNLDLNSLGKRLPVKLDNYTKKVSVPNDLSYTNVGYFGDHLILMGFDKDQHHISIYLYHKPSGKWSKLKSCCDHDLYSHKITRGYVWASHHRIVLLGDAEMHETSPSVQYFNLYMTVSLPFINASGSSVYYFNDLQQQQQQQQQQQTKYQNQPAYNKKSFIEYSRYMAPQVQMTSIKSAFPPYAVTLGKNAFERFGYSISEFEFLSADGDTTPIPSMLCRKRWGRCFEMLIAKGYVRAVDNFEKAAVNTEVYPPLEDTKSETASVKERDSLEQPTFRIPFQDTTSSDQLFLKPAVTTPSSESSRKLSVASTSSLMESSSSIDLTKQIPALKPQPSEPAPVLPKPQQPQQKSAANPLRTPSASSSPRGSISGGLQPFSQLDKKESHLKELTTSSSSTGAKSRVNSKGSLGFGNDETSSIVNTRSSGSTVNNSFVSNKPPSTKFISLQLELNSSKMEPLLLPRAIYLPFTTPTVKALLEFLSTGQVGSKWPIVPTTLDIILISKFYELPLLYDLVLEVLYSIIGNKENQIIAEANDLTQQHIDHMVKIGEPPDRINPLRVTCLEGFADFLSKFNDGVIDTSILKRISKSKYRKESVDSGKRKKSLDSFSSGSSSRAKDFSPMSSQEQQLQQVPAPAKEEEEIEEGDPRYKSEDDAINVSSNGEEEHNNSDNSSSDGIGVGIGLVPKLPMEEGMSREGSTTTASATPMKRLSESQNASSSIHSNGKKPSGSAASTKTYQFSQVGDSTWPTLGELTAVNAPACTDIILDFIYEIAALAGDMKLIVRAANIFDISQNFEIEKREILKLMGQNALDPISASLTPRLSQQKSRNMFGKFDISGSSLSSSRFEKRGSISSVLSNADSSHSTELAGSVSSLPLSASVNSSQVRLPSQLSNASQILSLNTLEKVATFDSAKSIPSKASIGSSSSSVPTVALTTPQRTKKLVVADGSISPTVTGESVDEKLKGPSKFTGLLKRK